MNGLLGEILDATSTEGVLPDEPEAQAEACAARLVDALRRLELGYPRTPQGRRALVSLVRLVDADVADHIIEALT